MDPSQVFECVLEIGAHPLYLASVHAALARCMLLLLGIAGVSGNKACRPLKMLRFSLSS
jgi:hypothetical protein